MILIDGSIFVNIDAIAYAELEKGFSGESKLRVMFTCGTEQRFTGAKMRALLGHLRASAANPYADPGEELG